MKRSSFIKALLALPFAKSFIQNVSKEKDYSLVPVKVTKYNTLKGNGWRRHGIYSTEVVGRWEGNGAEDGTPTGTATIWTQQGDITITYFEDGHSSINRSWEPELDNAHFISARYPNLSVYGDYAGKRIEKNKTT